MNFFLLANTMVPPGLTYIFTITTVTFIAITVALAIVVIVVLMPFFFTDYA